MRKVPAWLFVGAFLMATSLVVMLINSGFERSLKPVSDVIAQQLWLFKESNQLKPIMKAIDRIPFDP